ncbi:hypothetical protein [Vibrio sp. SCSIO 43137]|uniref:hypothetical protein n=1 Tax=Vibrio sp. SCSIO 43137 TaxID=3021011 RepID=UPI002307D887|nr:hypothetical protein [Vibrio sp. SCSIO 43137]WCE28711.1 hypothetical protein PK654_10055 [Vibrio sp. SCSIO 43137]
MMMSKENNVSRLALSISGVLLLSACGGGSGSSGTSNNATYAYQSLNACADTNLDGQCNEAEQEIKATSSYSRVLDVDGALLTAPAEASIITPFTTLLHSEMLFNPTLKGSLSNAQVYLQKVLGDHVNVDFSTLNRNHGPQDATQTLLKSLKQAQDQGTQSPLLNIAHALDVMIAKKTLDLSSVDLKKETNRHTSYDEQFTIHGSQNEASLVGAKSITYNPANNQIVFLDSSDEIKQLDTANSNSSSLSLTASTFSSDNQKSYVDDDDDDGDDDDHYSGGNITNVPGYTTGGTTRVIQVSPLLNSVQSYKVLQPTGSSTASTTCATSGNTGIFLTSLTDSGKSASSSQPTTTSYSGIDSFASASGSTGIVLPPPPPTPAPLSSESCFNDNFEWIKPIYGQDYVIAELDTGVFNDDLLVKLTADLKLTDDKYTLSSNDNIFVASPDGSKMLVLADSVNQPAKIIDLATMNASYSVSVSNPYRAAFASGNQIVFGVRSPDKVVWVDDSLASTELGSLDVDSSIRHVSSSPDGKYSAVVTNTSLYLLDNTSRTQIDKFTISGTSVVELFVLKDKAITVHNNSIHYFQFSGIQGSPLKVAAQAMTPDLLQKWDDSSVTHWGTTNLGYILENTGTNADAAAKFDSITVSWLPVGVTEKSKVTGVQLSGLDRGEWVTVLKAF